MEQLKEAQGQGLMVFEEGGPSSADQSYQQVRQSCLSSLVVRTELSPDQDALDHTLTGCCGAGSGHVSSQQAYLAVRCSA